MPPNTLATALLFQLYDRISDQEATDRTKFDQRWQVVLAVGDISLSDWLDGGSGVSDYSSRFTVPGENAGRQMATYSAPPSYGEL